MARVLHADQFSKSIASTKVNNASFMLEDFDLSDEAEPGLSADEAVPSQSSQEEVLADNIIKAAEFQAEELLTRTKNQADKLLEKAKIELDKAKAEAEKIIQDAQTGAIQIGKQAEQEAEQRIQKAVDTGFQQGLTQGQETASDELNKLFQVLQNLTKELDLFKEKILSESEAEILELVLVLSTKIVGFELSVKPDLILKVIQSGIKLLKDKRELTIRLNSDDLELVKKYRSALLRCIEETEKIYLTADEDLMPGECLIENKSNLVDSRWRRKISNAAETVWELYNTNLPSHEPGRVLTQVD